MCDQMLTQQIPHPSNHIMCDSITYEECSIISSFPKRGKFFKNVRFIFFSPVSFQTRNKTSFQTVINPGHFISNMRQTRRNGVATDRHF